MEKSVFFLLLLSGLIWSDSYVGIGPAVRTGSNDLNYWFSAGRFFHRGTFDTKLCLDAATDFQKGVFLSGSLGFNYYFVKDFFLAGMNFGFGSNSTDIRNDYGFIAGLSTGIALAERTFLIEPSVQAVLKGDFPLSAGLKIGMLFGK